MSSKHVERQERGDLFSSGTPEEELLTKPTKNPKPKKNVDHDKKRRDLYHSDIPEWLQEFRENLVDDRVPEHRDSHTSSSHEPEDQNHKGPVQKTHWQSRTSCRKFWFVT